MPGRSAFRPSLPALLGVALCLPIVALVLLASNNIVPPFALPDPEGRVRLVVRVVMLAVLFAPLAGFLLNVRRAWRGDRGSLMAASVALAVTFALVAFAVVDQWDCFAGVPNCD
ncbi:MAG: hypothetical protein AB7G21_11250 [Dehalococcoidia bacterium]